jgi:hypothetical protein
VYVAEVASTAAETVREAEAVLVPGEKVAAAEKIVWATVREAVAVNVPGVADGFPKKRLNTGHVVTMLRPKSAHSFGFVWSIP